MGLYIRSCIWCVLLGVVWLIPKVCTCWWEVVLESCDLLSHHNAVFSFCMTWSGWCLVLGLEVPEHALSRAVSSSRAAWPGWEAWLVLMQCFPCNACREVSGCYLGTGGKNGKIPASMLRRCGQGSFSRNLFAIIRESLEENEDSAFLAIRVQLWFFLSKSTILEAWALETQGNWLQAACPECNVLSLWWA